VPLAIGLLALLVVRRRPVARAAPRPAYAER
jgi:hypothetical protein